MPRAPFVLPWRKANAVAAAREARAGAAADAENPVQQFLNYMKETPAQRMEDSWLAAHHLTRKQLESMPAAKRQAIEQEMAREIKDRMKQAALDKPHAKGGILV